MRLIAVSPIGKNGQTVVPAPIRRMFKVTKEGRHMVGFYDHDGHVEIAPVTVEKSELDYTAAELNKVNRLAKQKGGRKFKSVDEAKKFVKEL